MHKFPKVIFAGAAAAVLGFATAGGLQAQNGFQQMAASATPQCKPAVSVAFGRNMGEAGSMWVATVNSQYGAEWAHWIVAREKKVFATRMDGTQVYHIDARPCLNPR